MNIAPIPPIAVPSVPAASPPAVTPGAVEGGDLFSSVSDALQTVSDSHARVDELATQAATGDLSAVHELTMATAEAQLLTQLTVEVRNRAVDAFNEIMRMQV